MAAGELLPAVGIPGLGMQPALWQTWMHHDCSKDLVVSVVGCAAPCLLFLIPNEVSCPIFLLKFLSPGRKACRTCAERSASVGPGVLLQFQVFQESSSALASGLISTPAFPCGLAVVRTGAAPAPTQACRACSSLALAWDFRASLTALDSSESCPATQGESLPKCREDIPIPNFRGAQRQCWR